jgi:nucleoside-diphosphate-sugar epimerase
MNIALTGSSGLIGSSLVKDLRKANHKIFCISSGKSSPEDNIFSYKDMLDCKILEPIDCMIHLASINSEMNELDIPLEVDITEKVIQGMKLMNCQKIIFYSTAKVYGDNSFDHKLLLETSAIDPLCSYSKAKMLCEEIISQSANTKSFEYLIFRMPPVLINHPRSNLGKLFQIVERGLPIPSFRAGDVNQRSFLSYELLASILEAAIQSTDHFPNEVFNLADTDPISTNDLLRRFASSIQKKAKIIYLPNFIFKAMLQVNQLQLILCRLFGNFYLSNAKLIKAFNISDNT